MRKHIYVMIRYSALTESSGAWAIGRDRDFESYKDSLFENERLKLHEKLFREVTLPSLKKMNPDFTSVLVFTSNELPAKYLNALQEMTEGLANFKVFTLPRKGKLISQMNDCLFKELQLFNEDVCYATVRVDDDDALSNNFYKNIINYVEPHYEGHAISFASGVVGFFDGGKYTEFAKRKIPMTALGLSFINIFKVDDLKPSPISVYSLGKHSNVDERYPVIVSSKKTMYIRTIHEGSDVYSDELKNKLLRASKVERSKVDKNFSINV